MQKALKTLMNDETGHTLMIAVMVMMALTALAILAARVSNINLATAVNDKHHKANYFKTDADITVFNRMLIDTVTDREPKDMGGDISVNNDEFAYNSAGLSCPDENNSDVDFVADGSTVDDKWKNTSYITVSIDEGLNPGSSLLIAEGYEGAGNSMAGGGFLRIYTIRALGRGLGNSQTRLSLQYQHIP